MPCQPTAIDLSDLSVGEEELFLEIFYPLIIQLEFSFKRSVRDPATLLQKSYDLIQGII
jgi:hypothetical protein